MKGFLIWISVKVFWFSSGLEVVKDTEKPLDFLEALGDYPKEICEDFAPEVLRTDVLEGLLTKDNQES